AASARSWNAAVWPFTAALYGNRSSRNQMLPVSATLPSGGAIRVQSMSTALLVGSHLVLPRYSSTLVAPVSPTSTSIPSPRSEKHPAASAAASAPATAVTRQPRPREPTIAFARQASPRRAAIAIVRRAAPLEASNPDVQRARSSDLRGPAAR